MKEGASFAVLKGLQVVFAAVTAHWLGLDKSVQVLLILMALDILTWKMVMVTGAGPVIPPSKAYYSASWRRVTMKGGAIIIILVMHIMTNMANDFPLPVDIGAVVAWYYVLNELISIVDNCDKLGVPIPPVLVDWIQKAKSFQEKKQVAAIEKVQAKAQEAVEAATQAKVSAKEVQKATEALAETIPVKTDT